jgi:hypothetical protein
MIGDLVCVNKFNLRLLKNEFMLLFQRLHGITILLV